MAHLELTKIFLHNWHRFQSELITVQDGLYLAGHNASGKSTILDALQVLLLADLDLIKFNSSAQERSERTLDGFVRGKIMENRLLRPGGAIGYIAIEFTEHPHDKKLTLGCCIEAAEKYGKQGRRAYFMLSESLDPELFLPENQPLAQIELRKLVRGRPNNAGRYYEHVTEYQEDMLAALGHLNRRFFDLFRRALSFGRIKDVGSFIEQWLLPEFPLDLGNLQQVVARLSELQAETRQVRTKLEALQQIVEKRHLYLQRKTLQEHYDLLLTLLQAEHARRSVEILLHQRAQLVEEITQKGNEQALRETILERTREEHTRLLQELFGLGSHQRQQALEKEMSDLEKRLTQENKRRKRIFLAIEHICAQIREIPGNASSTPEEAEQVLAFLAVGSTSEEHPLPETFSQVCARAGNVLAATYKRALEQTAAIHATITRCREQVATIAEELQRLRDSDKPLPYLRTVKGLREALTELLGSQPLILCEQVEIPDERWQTAVEAMLDWRRFLLLVPPGTYGQVLTFLDSHRHFQDASVLDLERAFRQRRPPQEHSLATKVQAQSAQLQGYLDSILGNIITCASAHEVREHARAITADLLYYSEWTVRRISAQRFQPWFVGQRAQRSQIEAREKMLDDLAETLARLNDELNVAKAQEERLNLTTHFARLQHDLEAPLLDRQLAEELDVARAEYASLDLSDVTALQERIKILAEQMKEDEKLIQNLVGELSVARVQKTHLEGSIISGQEEIQRREQARIETTHKYGPETLAEAESLFLQQSREPDLTRPITNTERAQKQFTTQAGNHLDDHKRLALAYNVAHQFAGLSEVPQDTRYLDEHQRLEATELPGYQAQIDQAQAEASQELREHVLHLLRERIANAKNELKRINDALKPLQFHGDRYSFHYKVAGETEAYYHLIEDSQVLGAGSLFESQYYQENQTAFERFYEEITGQKNDPHRQATQKRLADYRTYLEYDIRIERNGDVSYLSRIMGEQSGGETQTPFYVAIAASFVQLYRIRMGERAHTNYHERPTLRLAVFDEAFNQMDQDRIEATLELFNSYGLQVITATPLERCEYLVPKMCTNLVLTGVGDSVLVEPYRNYAARLKQAEENDGLDLSL